MHASSYLFQFFSGLCKVSTRDCFYHAVLLWSYHNFISQASLENNTDTYKHRWLPSKIKQALAHAARLSMCLVET